MNGRRSVSRTFFHKAVKDGRLEEVKRLLPTPSYIDVPNSAGRTALIEACANHHALMAHAILEGGADVDGTRPNEQHSPLLIACKLGSISLVDVLLYHGASVNVKYRNSWTPLLRACKDGHMAIVKALIDHGARVNICCGHGYTGDKTPLQLAISGCHVEIVKILLEHGARVNKADSSGWSPLHFACLKGNVDLAKALIDHGANVNAKEEPRGWTPLHVASQHGYANIVDLLLLHGASVNETDVNRRSALHIATDNEREPSSASNDNRNMVVELLLKRGAAFDDRDAEGVTPLRDACWDRNVPIVRALLRLGAKPIEIAGSVNTVSLYKATVILNKLNAECLSLVLDYCPIVGFCIATHREIYNYMWTCSHLPQVCLYSSLYDSDAPYGQEGWPHALRRPFIKATAAGIFTPNLTGASRKFKQDWHNLLNSSFHDDCIREVEIMKVSVITDTDATYYDVLHQDRTTEWSLRALKNLIPDDCVSRFPIYGEMIWGRFLMLQTFFLVNNFCINFFLLTELPRLPPEIACRILNYIPNRDLLKVANICKAAHPREMSKINK